MSYWIGWAAATWGLSWGFDENGDDIEVWAEVINGGGGDGPESYVDHEALIIAEREAKDEMEISLIFNVLVSEELIT